MSSLKCTGCFSKAILSAILFIDALKEQLETRFSRDDTSPTAALLQLVLRMLCTKSTDGLVDKLLFYEDDVPRPTSL